MRYMKIPLYVRVFVALVVVTGCSRGAFAQRSADSADSLLAALQSDDPEDRVRAACAFAEKKSLAGDKERVVDALANLLADERLAPELIQSACEAEELVPAVQRFLDDASLRERIAARYSEIHDGLRTDTNREAAAAVVRLLEERGLV